MLCLLGTSIPSSGGSRCRRHPIGSIFLLSRAAREWSIQGTEEDIGVSTSADGSLILCPGPARQHVPLPPPPHGHNLTRLDHLGVSLLKLPGLAILFLWADARASCMPGPAGDGEPPRSGPTATALAPAHLFLERLVLLLAELRVVVSPLFHLPPHRWPSSKPRQPAHAFLRWVGISWYS